MKASTSLDDLRRAAQPLRDGLTGWNGMAIEREYAELLYGLVRTLRPRALIETGTGEGRCSLFLATALRENGRGTLFTYEPDPTFYAIASALLAEYPATVVNATWSPLIEPDMVFLDSGPATRLAEIEYWLGGEGGRNVVVAIHDANRDYPFHLGRGIHLRAGDGLWLGRPR